MRADMEQWVDSN